jgi:hypothetical protein
MALTGIGTSSLLTVEFITYKYRYWKLILLLKLIPFVKECLKDRPNTLVQEDNVSPHVYRYQKTVYNLYNITRLLWPGNSPDLNVIEPA